MIYIAKNKFEVLRVSKKLLLEFSTEQFKAYHHPSEILKEIGQDKSFQDFIEKNSKIHSKKIAAPTLKFEWIKFEQSYEIILSSTEFKGYYLVGIAQLGIQDAFAKALRDSENRYREIVERAPWGISLFTPGEELIFTNQFNKPPPGIPLKIHQQMIMGLRFLQSPVFREPAIKECIEKVYRGRPAILAPFQFELPYSRYDQNIPNRIIWLECAFYPLKDVQGKLKEILLFHRDVSKSRKLESNLRQMEKMEVIGQITGGIAHDFNNQLTSMQGFAELIRFRAESDPKISHYTEALLNSIRRAGELTQQLLSFARTENQAPVELDVHRVLEEVYQICVHTFPKNIRLHQNLETKDFKILGDSSSLQNSILNLCINARDAMPEGGTLTLSTEIQSLTPKFAQDIGARPSLSKKGKYLVIGVSDTGTGVPPHLLSRIWEPFFTTKEKGKGTGMGLASVYGMAKHHLGAVSIQNQPQGGSLFSIYLPLLKDTTGTIKIVEKTKPLEWIHQPKVLIIDDEKQLGEFITDMLSSLEISAHSISDSEEGLKHFMRSPQQYQLILMDVLMPKLSGPALVPLIRKYNKEVPIVLMSGVQLPSGLECFKNNQVQGFLPKPFDLQTLRTQILPHLETREAISLN